MGYGWQGPSTPREQQQPDRMYILGQQYQGPGQGGAPNRSQGLNMPGMDWMRGGQQINPGTGAPPGVQGPNMPGMDWMGGGQQIDPNTGAVPGVQGPDNWDYGGGVDARNPYLPPEVGAPTNPRLVNPAAGNQSQGWHGTVSNPYPQSTELSAGSNIPSLGQMIGGGMGRRPYRPQGGGGGFPYDPMMGWRGGGQQQSSGGGMWKSRQGGSYLAPYFPGNEFIVGGGLNQQDPNPPVMKHLNPDGSFPKIGQPYVPPGQIGVPGLDPSAPGGAPIKPPTPSVPGQEDSRIDLESWLAPGWGGRPYPTGPTPPTTPSVPGQPQQTIGGGMLPYNNFGAKPGPGQPQQTGPGRSLRAY